MAEIEISPEERREFARLRSLLVSPGSVQLLHSDSGRRAWLTDQIVLLDVTGSLVLGADDSLDDGLYRLITTRGLVRKDGIATVSLPLFFGATGWAAWEPAWPTGWSITYSEAKAMLLYVDAHRPEGGCCTRLPLAMNEDVWRAFKSAYPDAALWHTGYTGSFRVSVADNDDLAYIQPVEIPPDMHKSTQAILEAIPDVIQRDPETPG